MSRKHITREAKCDSRVLVEAWTMKTSRATTGLICVGPELEKKGFTDALVSVFATFTHTRFIAPCWKCEDKKV
jgi:hypothetical protein